MTKPKNKIAAFILCFVLGPFGLFYINKKGGLFLSIAMALTLIIGFVSSFCYASTHPMTPDDINLLLSGTIPHSQAGLATIISVELGALIAEWVASMVWALVTQTTEN